MPQRHRPAYPAEFRERLVELVRSGRSLEELAREFEPSAQAIRNWVAQADRATSLSELPTDDDHVGGFRGDPRISD